MTTWQYKTERWVWGLAAVGFTQRKLDEKLNAAGAEGWELVSMLNTYGNRQEPEGTIAIFKRARVTPPPLS
jgi:hypothetical protein